MAKARKVDEALGDEVGAHLRELGIETPMKKHPFIQGRLHTAIVDVVRSIGLDLEDDSIKDTPQRVATMYADELFYGLDYGNFPKCTTVENKMGLRELVLERNVAVKSVCEHHLVPFVGVAHIAYIPEDKILGLSKLNRVTDFFSRRPQIQERLTAQVGEALSYILGTKDVAVIIKAEHMCVKLRGIEDTGSDTITSKMLGKFRDVPELRAELMSLINGGH